MRKAGKVVTFSYVLFLSINLLLVLKTPVCTSTISAWIRAPVVKVGVNGERGPRSWWDVPNATSCATQPTPTLFLALLAFSLCPKTLFLRKHSCASGYVVKSW